MTLKKIHLETLNYENTNTQDTIHIIPDTLCVLGTVNYYDIPGIFTI